MLNAALESPKQAAELQTAVAGKTSHQKAQVARVKTLARDYENARGGQKHHAAQEAPQVEERAQGWHPDSAQEQDNSQGWTHQQWNPEDDQNLENNQDQGYER